MASDMKHSIEEAVEVPQSASREEARATLALEGMTCASCAMRIEKGLKKVPGVKNASVNFATEQATVTFDPTQTGIEQLVQKVDVVGYKATPLVLPVPKPVRIAPETESHLVLDLEGMTCASCAMRIEKGLKKVPGVKEASVNLATELAAVTYDPVQTSMEQLMQKVEAIGYRATPQAATPQQSAQQVGASPVAGTPAGPVTSVYTEDEQ